MKPGSKLNPNVRRLKNRLDQNSEQIRNGEIIER